MTTQKIVTKTPELQVQGTVKTGHALQCVFRFIFKEHAISKARANLKFSRVVQNHSLFEFLRSAVISTVFNEIASGLQLCLNYENVFPGKLTI